MEGLTFEQLMADLERDREDRWSIDIDSSVALAHLFREPRRPADASFWGRVFDLQQASRIRGLEPGPRVSIDRIRIAMRCGCLLARVVLIELPDET